MSQYILEKDPLIQAQREGESITRRNTLGRDSSNTTKQGFNTLDKLSGDQKALASFLYDFI